MAALFKSLPAALSGKDYKVWVVDDGSKDKTAEVVSSQTHHMPLVLLQHERNKGMGAAFQTGLDKIIPHLSSSDILVTLDADNTHPPQIIPRLIDPLENDQADLAIASRYVPGAKVYGVSLFRQLTSQGARWLFQYFLPIPNVKDYTCGFRAYRGGLIIQAKKKWNSLVTENGFASAAEWLVKLSFLSPRVVEIPFILHYDHKPTASKMPVFRTILKTLALISRLRRIKD